MKDKKGRCKMQCKVLSKTIPGTFPQPGKGSISLKIKKRKE
jgi:hypothetical protein